MEHPNYTSTDPQITANFWPPRPIIIRIEPKFGPYSMRGVHTCTLPHAHTHTHVHTQRPDETCYTHTRGLPSNNTCVVDCRGVLSCLEAVLPRLLKGRKRGPFFAVERPLALCRWCISFCLTTDTAAREAERPRSNIKRGKR
jgi:hypothetical protein